MTAGEQESAAIRVLAGNPTDEELAAVVAVLSVAASEQPTAPVEQPEPSEWSRSARSLRTWTPGARWR